MDKDQHSADRVPSSCELPDLQAGQFPNDVLQRRSALGLNYPGDHPQGHVNHELTLRQISGVTCGMRPSLLVCDASMTRT